MINIKQEKINECIEELLPILDNYWTEADERRSSSSFNLDLESYKSLESLGLLSVFVARVSGVICGFTVFIVSPCSHTGESKACLEIMYIDPEYRGCSLADLLLIEGEKHLDVDYIFCTLKTEFQHDSLMSRNKYKHVENIYMKRVM